MPQRLAVIGTAGAGKTHLAGRVVATLELPHLEPTPWSHLRDLRHRQR